MLIVAKLLFFEKDLFQKNQNLREFAKYKQLKKGLVSEQALGTFKEYTITEQRFKVYSIESHSS